MKNLKGLFFVLAFGLVLLASVAAVLADDWSEDSADVSKLTVYVNSEAAWVGYCDDNGAGFDCTTSQANVPALERDGTMSVRVTFKAAEDVSNVRVRAWINGYREEIEDKTGEFDIFEGTQYTKTLNLPVPADIDAKDTFTLYVKLEAKQELHGVDEAKIELSTQRISNRLEILSINPWSQNTGKLAAGATFYTDVVVKNIGNHLTEDCYVKVSIPELKLERTVYVGDIGSYDNDYEDAVKTTVSMKLPEDVKSGSYKLVVQAYNSKLSTEATQSVTVNGIASDNGTDNTNADNDNGVANRTEDNFGWEDVLMIISIVLAVAIIVLLVVMLVKQKSCTCDEKPEVEAENYY